MSHPITDRRPVLGALLGFISLPLLLALAGAVSFHRSHAPNSTIVSSGQTREYLVYVPPGYDRTRPTPLVISLHGAGGWPAQQLLLTRWNRVADANGFIVAYPGAGRGPGAWDVNRGPGLQRDVRFIADLIDTLGAQWNIDRSRIYANGLSNGGGMTFVLSCALTDRLAAVGLVGAAQTLPSSWCTDHRPVPLIAFHGDADSLVPYYGGPLNDPFNPANVVFPPVRRWVANWARRNGCGASPVETAVAPDAMRISYDGCADGAAVILYTIAGGGHTWPGGEPLPAGWLGHTSEDVDASSLMWAFFRAHPRHGK